MIKKYLFHLTEINITGGTKSTLEICKGLIHEGHDVSIIIERNVVLLAIPKGIMIYHLSKDKVDLIDVNNIIEVNTLKVEKSKLRKQLSDIYLFKYFYLWLKYIFELIKFPKKYIVMKAFLEKNKFDLVVSSNMYNNLEHLFYYKNKCKTVLSIRNSPHEVFSNRILPKLFTYQLYFRNITCIGVSNDTTEEMQHYIDIKKTKLQTIYNPFDFNLIQSLLKEQIEEEMLKNKDYIITVGSLSNRKRVDLLLKVMLQLKDTNIHLVVIGDGPEKDKLNNYINENDLYRKVYLLGSKSNPFKYIANSKAFVLTSESEGLPRVLIESLICNTPIVSTNCPNGPREILINNLSDFLIEIKNKNEYEIVNELTLKIRKIVENPPLINQDDLSRFKHNKVIFKWIKLAE